MRFAILIRMIVYLHNDKKSFKKSFFYFFSSQDYFFKSSYAYTPLGHGYDDRVSLPLPPSEMTRASINQSIKKFENANTVLIFMIGIPI